MTELPELPKPQRLRFPYLDDTTRGAPGLHCPHCGKYQDAVTAMSGGNIAPRDGDYSVCVGCGQLSVFLVSPFGLSTRVATDVEHRKFEQRYPGVLEAAQRIRQQKETP